MQGKEKTLFKLYAGSVFTDHKIVYDTYRFCSDELCKFDILHLCEIGVPASKMKYKSEVKNYILDNGYKTFLHIKNSDMRKLDKQYKNLVLNIKKQTQW